jgi:DNA sulfur modification protein DndD
MRLVRADFKNFRLLRDLALTFSTDPNRKLTVIRAANETGKTTALTALQWALYGDSALPGRGDEYRLHPIDWNVDDGPVPIVVSVDFEVVSHRRTSTGDLRPVRRMYRIIRSAYESLSGTTWRRDSSGVRLLALNETGTTPIENPEAEIRDHLPPDLREVFFTDGDRALSFIEADVALSTKRDRVQRAIRSLLGLGVIEDAIRHVQRSAAEVNKSAKRLDKNSDLAAAAARLETIDDQIVKLEADLVDAKQQFASFDEEVAESDRKIASALQKGDRDKLRKDLEQVQHEIERLNPKVDAATKSHAALFRDEALAADLLAPRLEVVYAKLDDLRDRGKIPNATIPVLEDRLAQATCICGESLVLEHPGAEERRLHIQGLIDSSRRADEIQTAVTELYYQSKAFLPSEDAGSRWMARYRQVIRERDELHDQREDAGRRLKALEVQLDALPDTDIQGLREARRDFLQQRDRFLGKKSQCETQLDGLRAERERLKQSRDSLLREQKKGARVLADLEVTQDIVTVLKRAYERITNDELRKVSALMNTIFLEMIGADPEQGAIVRQAEITEAFDIVVYGPNGRTLNPDRDLNGASRRALTIAFILALTKVSEVEAPNVIDTPLGMMSGYVKRSVLRKTIEESAQPVLFLTHAEIEGCEDILDGAAGVVVTLTNPAHYPRMLVNDPGVLERRVLSCDCDHRRVCNVCERRLDMLASV